MGVEVIRITCFLVNGRVHCTFYGWRGCR